MTKANMEEPDLTIARSIEELRLKQEVNAEVLGLGTIGRWDLDQDRGLIKFTHARRVINAHVQIIGSLNTRDSTWLWAWDNPSVLEPLRAAALRVQEFGARHGLSDLVTRKVMCTEAGAWEFTALAAHLTSATGAYRGPTGATYVFMTFSGVTITPGESLN